MFSVILESETIFCLKTGYDLSKYWESVEHGILLEMLVFQKKVIHVHVVCFIQDLLLEVQQPDTSNLLVYVFF